MVFALTAGIALMLLGSAFASCYPGGVSYDAANQWRQAQTGEFNNWHPVFHTLLIWLFTRVFNSYTFVVLVQLVFYAMALGYAAAVLHQNGVPAWLAVTVCALVTDSAPVKNALMYVWKDNAMTIGCLVLFSQCTRLLFSRGKWLQKPLNALAFGLMLAFVTLVRHNGFLFSVPLLALVLCCYGLRQKGVRVATLAFALCMLVVKGPLYGALDIVYPSNTTEEAVGIPMMILGNARQTAPEALDAETVAFLDRLAPEKDWQTVYRRSDYNAIKFTYPREYIKEIPITDIVSMALRTACRAPRLAFDTINEATSLVWDVSGKNEGYESVSNSGDLPEAAYGNDKLQRIGKALSAVWEAPLSFLPLQWLTCNIGVQLLLLLWVTLWALYRGGVDRLLFAVPVLCYHLATMLMLCGQDARFFQYSMALSLPAIVALLYAPATEGG